MYKMHKVFLGFLETHAEVNDWPEHRIFRGGVETTETSSKTFWPCMTRKLSLDGDRLQK